MTDVEAARSQLRNIVRELEALRFRLLGLSGNLPVSLEENVHLLDLERADPKTEIRTVIQCVLQGSIEPAIGDLRAVAEHSV